MPQNQQDSGWKVLHIPDHEAEQRLRDIFQRPPDSMNFVLFSTGGAHGWSNTIEESADGERVTFILARPRILSFQYGSITVTRENREWLTQLRDRSCDVMATLGKQKIEEIDWRTANEHPDQRTRDIALATGWLGADRSLAARRSLATRFLRMAEACLPDHPRIQELRAEIE